MNDASENRLTVLVDCVDGCKGHHSCLRDVFREGSTARSFSNSVKNL